MPVGFRLGSAGFNLVYGGKGAITGPTLSGCALAGKSSLKIQFNTSLLRGEKVLLNRYNASLNNIFTGPPPELPIGNTSANTTWQQCFDAIAPACKSVMPFKVHQDCGNCKSANDAVAAPVAAHVHVAAQTAALAARVVLVLS